MNVYSWRWWREHIVKWRVHTKIFEIGLVACKHTNLIVTYLSHKKYQFRYEAIHFRRFKYPMPSSYSTPVIKTQNSYYFFILSCYFHGLERHKFWSFFKWLILYGNKSYYLDWIQPYVYGLKIDLVHRLGISIWHLYMLNAHLYTR